MTDASRPTDQDMIRDAIDVAKQAVERGEAPIGVVLYDADGQRVAQGWNQRRSTGDGTRHAEMVALAAAAEPGRPAPERLTLASTLEPCVMCWGACLEMKVARVVYGLEAPPNGGSTRVHDKQRGFDLAAQVERDACRQLFVDWLRDHEDSAGSDFVQQLLDTTS
jgi:tRNA(adenine34) deaminase